MHQRTIAHSLLVSVFDFIVSGVSVPGVFSGVTSHVALLMLKMRLQLVLLWLWMWLVLSCHVHFIYRIRHLPHYSHWRALPPSSHLAAADGV